MTPSGCYLLEAHLTRVRQIVETRRTPPASASLTDTWTPLFNLARGQGRYGPPGLALPVDESLELLRVALAVHPDLRSGRVDVA